MIEKSTVAAALCQRCPKIDPVKIVAILIVLLAACGFVRAQTNDLDLGDMLDSVQQFAQDAGDLHVWVFDGHARTTLTFPKPTPFCRCSTRMRKRSLMPRGCGRGWIISTRRRN